MAGTRDDDRLRDSYDHIADAYAERLRGELDDKPLDRMLLDHVVARAPGLIADIGCGPGHVTRYLTGRGAIAYGIDLSPRMVKIAARANPGTDVRVGDMRRLEAPDTAWGGIVAMYSIVHLTPVELPGAIAEFHRTLRPGGVVLLAFHLGDPGYEARKVDEMLGCPVDLDFYLYPRAVVEDALAAAGLVAEAYLERRPYPTEAETTRAYVLASRPRG